MAIGWKISQVQQGALQIRESAAPVAGVRKKGWTDDDPPFHQISRKPWRLLAYPT